MKENKAIHSARGALDGAQGEYWMHWVNRYLSACGLLTEDGTYDEALTVFDDVVPKIIESNEALEMFPQPGYAPRDIIAGQMRVIRNNRSGVIATLEALRELQPLLSGEENLTDRHYELMVNVMFSLLIRYNDPGTDQSDLFKAALYFARARVKLLFFLRP